MPTYGYRCSNCGHEFEIRQKMTDEPLRTCPNCQGKLTKILYPVGISFKGSGFYTTDYKSSGSSAGVPSSNGAANSSEGGSESKPESPSKSESKSETKSASKPDSKTEKKTS